MIRLCAFADESGKELEVQARELCRHGISLIELRNVNGKNVSDLTDEEAVACREYLAANGITVWSVGSPLGKVKLSEAEAHMQKVERVCHLATLLGADKIRVFSFFEAGDADFEAVKGYLARMTEIAARHGVGLYHENEKDIYGDTLARVKTLIDARIPGLGFVFDPANYIQCGEDIPTALEALFDKTDYFHIKDVVAATGQLVPAGHGDGCIGELVDRIAASGRDRVLTLEPHLKVFEGYGQIDNTVLHTAFTYGTNQESFAAAVEAMKKVLADHGHTETVLEDGTRAFVK